MWGVVAALIAAVTVVGLAWYQGDPQPRIERLVIATGVEGGVYHQYGEGIDAAARDEFPGAIVRVLTTQGSVENLRMVASGEADLAFTLADSAEAAMQGDPPFAAPQQLAAVARLYDNYMHLVVLNESPIKGVANLRGRRVYTGSKDSGTKLTADRLLEVAHLDTAVRLDRRDLNLQESVDALTAGQIDAFFFSGGLPTRAIAKLAKDEPIRLISLADHVGDLREQYPGFYAERTIPASTYGLADEVTTVGVPTMLVVPAEMTEATAHAVTCLLFTAKDTLVEAHPEARRLNLRAASSTSPVRLHPGAASCYREAKP